MRVYLVGGAVRDHALGLPTNDRDWVVVDSSEDEMLSLGFTKVGADFPVFLHPDTGEEWALARRERKTGSGYLGFDTQTENVTLEDDLLRRDFTINSIAQDLTTGELIDPFNGLADLAAGVIRHTSPAFVEDPLRILRAFRFAARYGFTIHPSTAQLISEMLDQGMLDQIHFNRIYAEFVKAAPHAQKFFALLTSYNAHTKCKWLRGIVVAATTHVQFSDSNYTIAQYISVTRKDAAFEFTPAETVAMAKLFAEYSQLSLNGESIYAFIRNNRLYGKTSRTDAFIEWLGDDGEIVSKCIEAYQSVKPSTDLLPNQVAEWMVQARINSINECLQNQ